MTALIRNRLRDTAAAISTDMAEVERLKLEYQALAGSAWTTDLLPADHRGRRLLRSTPASTVSVYFIRHGEEGPIKIGSAASPEARLAMLQTGNPVPLHLLKAIPGGERRERELHRQFAHLRVSGEWFRPSVELLDFIAGAA